MSNTNPYQSQIDDFVSKTISYLDAFNNPGKIEHYVNPLVPKGALILVAGASGAVKTGSMVYAGIDIAAGLNFLKLPTEQATVLLIDEEMGEYMMRPLIASAGLGANVTRDIPFYFISYAGVNFTDKAEVKKCDSIIRGAIAKYGAGVIILDSLHRLIPGKSDSDIKDVTPMLDALLRITRDLGVTIILIHHWNKNSPTYRGSTAIQGMVDMLINIIKNPNGKTITFEIDKNRFGPSGISIVATADWSNGKFTLTGKGIPVKTKTQPKMKPSHLDIIEALRSIGGTGTFVDITQALISIHVYAEGTVRNGISELTRSGDIVRTNPGNPGDEAIYQLYETITDPWFHAANPREKQNVSP